jgi:hypothetical protein
VARSIDPLSGGDQVNFGDLPEAVDGLLQQGVAAYRGDYARADALFRQALAAAPHVLPTYYCLYKIHTYRGHLDEALAVARAGLQEAARQAGWSLDWRDWSASIAAPEGAARFALYTLKAMAFIHLAAQRARTSHANSRRPGPVGPARHRRMACGGCARRCGNLTTTR